MGAFIFLILFFLFFTFQTSFIQATSSSCHATKFDIRYPFQLKGPKAQYEAHPGFELLCRDNTTTIHFPSYGDLVVKSISYDTKRIDLLDPSYCSHRVFLNLDLSPTPFRYYYVLKNFTYINCSISLSPSLMEVPCLSGSNYHVYTVDPAIPVPVSCKRVKTVGIPFEYSPYLSDNSLGLGFIWDLPQSEESEARIQARNSHTTRNTVMGFSICVFLVLTLVSIKAHGSARNSCEKEGQLLNSPADV